VAIAPPTHYSLRSVYKNSQMLVPFGALMVTLRVKDKLPRSEEGFTEILLVYAFLRSPPAVPNTKAAIFRILRAPNAASTIGGPMNP